MNVSRYPELGRVRHDYWAEYKRSKRAAVRCVSVGSDGVRACTGSKVEKEGTEHQAYTCASRIVSGVAIIGLDTPYNGTSTSTL